ncbi:methionyl-tRNA formyltransferase [Christiangramia forsetii]|uniref:Methionyl-tRNA formyltransferase n=2 Tax=Christiangramia forsetii TaxID=411153 RepID=A0M1C2_CHRFK|nr:methionyl-tRNA formyltransferase [Christiangramia forsetii]GGG42881.1 methionyl-tRNA formyltransferase [Christiangramia forsetii]CAL66417.1 methionyl-tRNA formyltransferase [Christiangramia forsetii KT0803]
MRDLRIVFMGTPEFAVNSLEAILDAGYNVVGVITAPDKPAGRGRKLRESAVKSYALSKDLKVLQPANLKSEEFQSELIELKPNVQVVVAFRMLPKSVWDLPEYGTFNLHASLLPQYRGAAPINWAIINGEEKTGVSTFFLDEKIDTGAMIFQEEISIDETENLESLHDRLMNMGAKLIVRTLKTIASNTVTTEAQEDSETLRDAPKLSKENTKIDWNAPVEKIYNLIRGLNPYPAAWCYLANSSEELKVKIYDIEKVKQEHRLPNGTITISDNMIKVAAINGYILVNEIQLPGKRKMLSKALLNGFNFAPDAKMR